MMKSIRWSASTMAIIGLFLTNLFWSGNIYVSKLLVNEIPPIVMNTSRWLVAGVLLTPFAIKSSLEHRHLIKKNILMLLVYAFLGVTIYNSFLYTAAHSTLGINMAVISSLTPVITFLLIWLFTGSKPSTAQFVGLFLGVLGVLLLISNGSFNNLTNLDFNRGDFLVLLAVLSWAIYTALMSKKPPELPLLVFLYVTIVLGFLLALPLVFLEYSAVGSFSLNQTSLLALLYIGIFPSVLAYLFYNYAVVQLGGNMAALSSYLLPVFTAAVSVVLLDESLQWFHYVGQLFVFAGFSFAMFGQYFGLNFKGIRRVKE